MITRIVKIKVKCQDRNEFVAFMNNFRLNVKMAKDNHHVDFFNDLEDACDFHIYTIWKTKTALNSFLKSETNLEFKKKLGNWGEKPYAAWTVENI
jgi:quinol monooxygenase YgiN